MPNILKNSSVLITGGTGSFGKKMVETLLTKKYTIKRLVIFSRDELKQSEMMEKYPSKRYPNLRFFIGDIRDVERLKRAFHKIDYVIHAAALKQVPAAEYNPTEFIKTNIIGSQNIIEAAIDKNVKKVIALSTDKAASPINLYGATKLCSDKLFVSANNYAGIENYKFSIVRYGNVLGSRGSIIPYLLKTSKNGHVNITDLSMTRFNITLDESIEMVLFALKESNGGEIFVPKIPSYRLKDLVKAVSPNCKVNIIGIRPGEKTDEEMISASDSFNTIDIGKYFIILPSSNERILSKISQKFKIKKFPKNTSYNSATNKNFLSVLELRKMIKENIDKKFSPF
jgi:UDP-N-acetylglucosamine 4,6-dehydratase